MVSRSEIDMKQIKEEYKKNYGKTLYMDILVSSNDNDFNFIIETQSILFGIYLFFTCRMTLKETMRKFFLLSVEMATKSDEGSRHWRSNCGKLFARTVKIEDTVMFYWHWAKNNMMFTHSLQMFSFLLQQSWDLTAVCRFPVCSSTLQIWLHSVLLHSVTSTVTPLACWVMQRKWSQCSF